jgi:hypothetical protein
MTDFLVNHWALSILFTILLGALGSGLWDTIFKPSLHKVGLLLFTIATLGAKRASDNVYKEAARGHHELSSLYLLMYVILGLVVFEGSLVGFLYSGLYGINVFADTTFESCEQLAGYRRRACRLEVLKQTFGLTIHLIPLLFIFVTVILLYRILSINRVNLVITYYNHCLKVCRPFLPTEDISDIEHRFALMETKADYLKIIDTLRVIAQRKEISLPKPYA